MTRGTRRVVLVLLLGSAAGSHALAEEGELLARLQRAYPGTQFTAVSRTPIEGVFEVVMGGNIAYVGRDPRYFLFGRLVDVERMQDLTAPKLAKEAEPAAIAPLRFDELPARDALRSVRGSGARRLAVFSDPVCPWCRALETQLDKLRDVTIHTFLVPFQGGDTARRIWCSADREGAWRRYMLSADASGLAALPDCDDPLARNLGLAARLGVRATPTLVAGDGRMRVGNVEARELERWLDEGADQLVSSTDPEENQP